MRQSTKKAESRHFSPRAALAAIGVKLRCLNLFAPIQEKVTIPQKVVKHTPVQKLYDGFIALLAGAHGLVEINKRLRADPALQAAFGREACAEQSVVQETLDACTQQNVEQMHQAMDAVYRRHSRGFRHDYTPGWQLLDVDITGSPCGKKAEFASKGYFAKQRNRRGCQLGRVLATFYEEVVVDRLLAGTAQLSTALQPLMEAAEQTLGLDEKKRARTIVRLDSGGGSVHDLNYLLERGYQIHGKDYSGTHARALAETVTAWVDDPKVEGRQVGWVLQEATGYVRAVQRVAVRCRKKNGQWGVGVLVSSLSAQDVIGLTGQPFDRVRDPQAVLLAYVYFYDGRSGGVETAIKGDKQGLGLTKRNKKRFAAQQMLVQLGALAHNVVVWARDWLAAVCPALARYGIVRMVRDVFTVSGLVVIEHLTDISEILLNQADPLGRKVVKGLRFLLAPDHVAISLGET